MRAALVASLLTLAAALPGCLGPPAEPAHGADSYRARGFDGTTWPRLDGETVTVLAYESFAAAFGDLAEAFHNLTGANAVLVTEADSGRVLERAVREKGDPTFDVVYGVDNVLFGKAERAGLFDAYEPVLASRVDPALAFAPGWTATPVTHGYVAVNVDPRAGLAIEDLDDVREHAGAFVTEDPRASTPGLGFLLATIATYGDSAAGIAGVDGDAEYEWNDYWTDLLEAGALVAPDWTAAYVGRFSGGYGQFEDGARTDKALVTSYSTSPAYEAFYGYETLNDVVLAPKSTFHQVQVMGVAAGADHAVAAQAFIEFALTDAFQGAVAEGEAVYPVARGVSTDDVYAGKDPAPGSFADSGLTYVEIDANVERWLREWTDLYERSRA